MARKPQPNDEKAAVVSFIVDHPTASDAQVAAATEVPTATVMDVRAEMGAKHSWPKTKSKED